MKKLLRAYKTEINPTEEQKVLIHKTIGICRFIYNFYIAHNKEVYEKEKKFVSGMDFSKWLNNDFIPSNSDYSWIKEVSSKSAKKSIMDAESAFKKFFKKQAKFPKFKKKGKSDVKMYFVKTDSKAIIPCERHRIKIPTLGWVQLKEKGYIPTNSDIYIIKSGTVSVKAGRYYVSVLVEQSDFQKVKQTGEGIGIDLGLKDFAVLSDGRVFKNINKTHVVRKLNKQLKRKQRSLSRKYEALKERNKNGEATRQNIQKNLLEVQKLHQRINNIHSNYINHCVAEVVKTKPQFVTIEDLNVKGMMKNRHLSKAVAEQNFYTFREKLTAKCNQLGIEVRVAGRFFPSSKMCHKCGAIKSDLRLKDRWYKCDCGYENDRDFNASLNLRDLEVYKLA
ncbi:MAG: transposase [Bacilli bacterium]|nr:transposase [Bacilli bacterium]